MCRWLSGLLTVSLWFVSVACASEEISVSAKAAILMEYETGRVLYAWNADTLLPMASTTKIMTCLLALENTDLTEIVTASKNASGVPGTSIYLSVGESLSMEDMLYGLMLRSGNDAAVAIAEHIDGSVAAFAQHMNARAMELGATSNYVTPNGLDADGHSITARGLALVTRAALRLPTFRTIVSTTRKIIPWVDHDYSRVLTNKNQLLTTYDGAIGVKTGFTSRAGRCLVFAAEREEMVLIGVLLNCGTWFDTAKEMLNWGFDTYDMHTVWSAGETVAEVAVEGGEVSTVNAIVSERVALPQRATETYSVAYELHSLTAPVAVGDPVGMATVYTANGDVLVRAPLAAGRAVAPWNWARALRRVLTRWIVK